ncbi:AzlC family ABC transporter permease [Chelatococcus sambhunathii]|uniref:AzlC family ABC transporter permease n=1 Tax=Chelatococcus sambhunathii TaxID=363953 RepID=A0ABU1DE95_9HYPH|nr:AzlC family ABC transporter permease [Chelatococcus sambhunathii]MDR4306438.1 AzlC family ABC transporter permease [Chelatococcus sambhunathii]
MTAEPSAPLRRSEAEPEPVAVDGGPAKPPRDAFLQGLRASISTPGFVLWGSFIGFGAMTHDFGWPLWLAAFSTALIWAAPGQLVLAGALASGAGLAGATFAVSISGVRLLPMVVAIMPVLRSERTRFWTRILAAHFVAVTAWFEGLRLASALPRAERMPFFFGLAAGLVVGSVVSTATGHAAAGLLPRALAVGLLGLTPMYFLMSLERGADGFAEKLAIGLGLVIGPLAGLLTQEFDLIATGLIGGTAAFFAERFRTEQAGS